MAGRGHDMATIRPITLQEARRGFLAIVGMARSPHTARAYNNALNVFYACLEDAGLTQDDYTNQITEEHYSQVFDHLARLDQGSEALYLVGIARYLEYLAAYNLAEVNLAKIKLIRQIRARRKPCRLVQFPEEQIEALIQYMQTLPLYNLTGQDTLIAFRDKALILTLADTGMRIFEACGLKVGQIDQARRQARIIGKGNREGLVRFSKRSMAAIEQYLNRRAFVDVWQGKEIKDLALFSRHDKAADGRVDHITTAGARMIIKRRAGQALGQDQADQITPHKFRHYFVTIVLRASKNLKLAQELARHQDIGVTARYAHLTDTELDTRYKAIFTRPEDPRQDTQKTPQEGLQAEFGPDPAINTPQTLAGKIERM